jgi:hypothetical protein
MISINFGKMVLGKCADVVGLVAFAAGVGMCPQSATKHQAALFVIAHEMWQPDHMSLFLYFMEQEGGVSTISREKVQDCIAYVYLAHLRSGAQTQKNGLQSGLICATHGIRYLYDKHNWASSEEQWGLLLQVGGWLVSLISAKDACEFNGLLQKIRKVDLRGVGVQGKGRTYAPDHLVRSFCHVMGIKLPAGCCFSGMDTLQVCQVNGLVAAGERSNLSVQKLYEHMQKISPQDMELAMELHYPRPEAHRVQGVQYMCAKDVYFALRHSGFFGGSGDWAPGRAVGSEIGNRVRDRQQAAVFMKLPQNKKQKLIQ